MSASNTIRERQAKIDNVISTKVYNKYAFSEFNPDDHVSVRSVLENGDGDDLREIFNSIYERIDTETPHTPNNLDDREGNGSEEEQEEKHPDGGNEPIFYCRDEYRAYGRNKNQHRCTAAVELTRAAFRQCKLLARGSDPFCRIHQCYNPVYRYAGYDDLRPNNAIYKHDNRTIFAEADRQCTNESSIVDKKHCSIESILRGMLHTARQSVGSSSSSSSSSLGNQWLQDAKNALKQIIKNERRHAHTNATEKMRVRTRANLQAFQEMLNTHMRSTATAEDVQALMSQLASMEAHTYPEPDGDCDDCDDRDDADGS